jgi:hypothetical protein
MLVDTDGVLSIYLSILDTYIHDPSSGGYECRCSCCLYVGSSFKRYNISAGREGQHHNMIIVISVGASERAGGQGEAEVSHEWD